MTLDLPHCYPAGETVVIAGPSAGIAEATLDAVLEPFQPLRERFTAVTGLGLPEEIDAEAAAIRRAALAPAADGTVLSYLFAGDPDGREVIFIHGSPGLAEEWGSFLGEVPRGQHRVAVDRPGFGDSSDKAVVALSRQAAAIAPLMAGGDDASVVLVGYSYGGPVALHLAAHYPEQVAGVLLVGSAADPKREETHPLQELVALDFFSSLLPRELANANQELLALKPELEELAAELGRIRAPVTILQGLDDTLVPAENAAYLAAMLPPSNPARVIMVEDADHFLPWTHHTLLEVALSCVLQDAIAHSPAGPPRDR